SGFRPLSPDGVPIVGKTRLANLFVNTGHGHIGWTTAAGSARLLADVMMERAPVLPAGEYALARL
ncbi:MAG: FAD-dependent oxidoreductase, partial [Alphaproteobacteria bacterium]|nr:FAD-dependent oxidoreductase [Alphaproteobacteria bacterium]